MSKIGIILVSCLLVVSCQNQKSELDSTLGKYHMPEDALDYEEVIEIEPPRTGEAPSPPEYTLEKGSKIIRNGEMNFEVTDLELAKNKIDTILNECNGYYENEKYKSLGNRISYTLKLRIPNSKFDSLINMIEKGVGELKSKNITARDVTEEYVDLNIRLENNLAYLNQYKEILKKANSVKEILQVQEKIRRIEEEIDSKKGRLKYLDDKVNFSTLNLELNELITSEISNKPKFGRRLVNAFNNGVQGFLSFIIGLVNLWPLFVLVILIYIGRKPILKIFKKEKTPPNSP